MLRKHEEEDWAEKERDGGVRGMSWRRKARRKGRVRTEEERSREEGADWGGMSQGVERFRRSTERGIKMGRKKS